MNGQAGRVEQTPAMSAQTAAISAQQIIRGLQPELNVSPTRGIEHSRGIRMVPGPLTIETGAQDCNLAGSRASATLIGFETGRSTITPQLRVTLANAATKLKTEVNAGRLFFVRGYADATGSPEVNDVLSIRRAEATVQFLAGEGIPRSRLAFGGSGALAPLKESAAGLDDACNRRVEIYILEGEKPPEASTPDDAIAAGMRSSVPAPPASAPK